MTEKRKRVTVYITTPDYAPEREFHLFEDQAERFAAKVRADGGTARIGPFKIGAELFKMLTRVGIDPERVR